MKKVVKVILFAAGISVLLLISGIIGVRVERSRQEALEMQKEYVSAIAVVNMDDGIMTGGEQVNYASKLLSFPNDHFSVTGLTDAKAGIENGRYAAYIVIPETFSASVTSIENNPGKVTLTCQYNSRLDEETKVQTVNDINAFTSVLNSNVAYMYMDAILAEFHRVQDDSATILSNDNTELELLESVNALQLIAAVENVEEMRTDNDIQPVALDPYSAQNIALLNDMVSHYSAATQKGKDDYAVIKEESAAVETAAGDFFQLYDTVVQEMAAAQSQSIATGREKLTEAVRLRNQNVEGQETELRDTVADIINIQLEKDQAAAESQLQDIVGDIRNKDEETLKKEQQKWDDKYQESRQWWEERVHDLQQAWLKFFQDIQPQVDENLARKKEGSNSNVEGLIEDAYIEGYNVAMTDISGQLELLKEDADAESIAVSRLQEAISDSMRDKPLKPEEKEYVEDYKEAAGEQINGISVDWDQLEARPPDISGNDPGGTEGEGGETGDGEGTGEEEPGTGAEDTYEISLAAFDDEEVIGSAVRETMDLFRMESESQQIDSVIQTYFVDALSEESERQKARLSDEKPVLSRSMENYESRLAGFEPMQYIEGANLGTYLNDIDANAGEMLRAVEQNNSEYMLYAMEMYTNTEEHTTQVRNSLDDANAQTAENVADCVNELILSRESLNSQNVSMLEGFTGSLRYTRVGRQGNAEVYDYIVNPLAFRTNEQAAAKGASPASEQENSIKTWLVIMLGLGIAACLAGLVINFRKQYKQEPEESEEVF